jgi:hypothetical protein
LIILIIAVFLIGLGIIAYKSHQLHYDIWICDYLFNSPAGFDEDVVTDIIFFKVDHWEPGENEETVNEWMRRYRELADKHIDNDGVKLQHTFFYPLEQFRGYQVDSLVRLCRDGYGDVEVHLHHKDDTYASLKDIFLAGIDSMQAHGALISSDSQVHFSFIHGNWALDNSWEIDGINVCGVNNEITLLLELGCYADFTFPALQTSAQPSWVNKICYAEDDPDAPKSYEEVIQSQVGFETTDKQLMIFQGPLMINWSDWRFKTHPTIDDADVYNDMMPSFERFELWLSAKIHVLDNPNWIFVRAFTHGGSVKYGAVEANLGEDMDKMMSAVEEKYKNNPKYRLHYMTAREVYNVVKAAEAGMKGNANDYRDYIIKPYMYP